MPRSTLPTCAASASLPAAETMTGGEHFRHPGRRWQLCETPYLATRGRGDMRGVPNRSTSIAPRRWCGAVLPPWCGVYHLVYHMVVWCNDGLPPPPGWHIWDAVWWSPHVADTPVGEIRGYAQRQPPTGVGNYLAFGHHLPTAEWQRWHPKPGAAYLPDLQKSALLREGQGTGIHPQ